MKKILLISLILSTVVNVSHASFPVLEDFIVSIDTIILDTNNIIKKETIEDYHLRMQKQGFDINNCMCEDCRRFKGSYIKEDRHANSRKYFGTLGFGVLIVLLIVVIFVLITFIRFLEILIEAMLS